MNKDWTGTKDSAFKMLGASNHCDEEREENDFYATDPKAIDKLLEFETFEPKIWENACGQGHLSEKLKEHGYEVYSTDLIDRGYQDDLVDFLSATKKFDGDIITNPPYKYCTEFILKGLELTKNKVAMFLKLQTLESQKRYDQIFSKYPPKSVYVFVNRIECGKNGKFTGSSAVCYAWFVWEKEYKGDTILKWIK
jgi:16S rRNA A1518/A1519 N6-dimethyltransferase RsmA/KsgA/DIM1 with predicted DNA glycosylase/AP lyase activity